MTASALERHRASADKLPQSRSCAFCQVQSTRTTRRTQLAEQDADQPSVARAAQGLRSSRGGGDTPWSGNLSKLSAAINDLTMSYPAGSADDEASLNVSSKTISFSASPKGSATLG